MTDTHAPTLEMLWEEDDPGVALVERFGFRDDSLLLVPPGDDSTGWGSEALSQLRKVGEDA